MAMGTRKQGESQEEMWVARAALPTSPGHPFYQRLQQLLDENQFDAYVEGRCQRFYSEKMGRPSLAPGVYFRLLLIGYFEGIDSERGIAWRASDSLGLRRFLRIGLEESGPDHSTISRTRRRIDVETHQEVFQWVLRVVAENGLLKGQTVAIDATTLEANAALRSIVRRDSGEGYQEFLQRLAKESGMATPTREDLARLDRKRRHKGSNDEWEHPHDPEARITKMKDGRTHLAHKVEQAVDLGSGAVVAVTIQGADQGDTATVMETLAEAGIAIAEVACATNNEEVGERVNPMGPAEVVLDKGYHSNETLVDLKQVEVRTYCSEPDRGRRRWKEKREEQAAVYANRRRIGGERGKGLMRQRGEKMERSFAHVYETGGLRRVHLRGHRNILKRVLVHVAGFNLGVVMRRVFGKGTPRGLQGHRVELLLALLRVWMEAWAVESAVQGSQGEAGRISRPQEPSAGASLAITESATSTTGC